MAITKIHAVKVRLGDAINYIENPDKTDGQELISGYNTASGIINNSCGLRREGFKVGVVSVISPN